MNIRVPKAGGSRRKGLPRGKPATERLPLASVEKRLGGVSRRGRSRYTRKARSA